MMTVVAEIDRPVGQAIGVKEDLAMYCEKFGDVRIVSVTESKPEQTHIDGFPAGFTR